MQALDSCLAEATTDENALTTALALLPTTVASLDAQQYNELITKVAALDDAGRSDLEPRVAPPKGVVYAGPAARPRV